MVSRMPITSGASASPSSPRATMVARGTGDARAPAARGALAPHLFADGPRRTEQARQPADVDRHEIVAMPLEARRKLLRDRHQVGPHVFFSAWSAVSAWLVVGLRRRRPVETCIQGLSAEG